MPGHCLPLLPRPRHFLIEHLPIDGRTAGADWAETEVFDSKIGRFPIRRRVRVFKVANFYPTVLVAETVQPHIAASPQQPQPRRRFDVRSAGDSPTVFGAHDSLQLI
jgi:hypothetical protein